MKASAKNSSLEATREDLEGAANSNTMGEYLNEALGGAKLREQEETMKVALVERTISDEPHQLEIHWQVASADNALDGRLNSG